MFFVIEGEMWRFYAILAAFSEEKSENEGDFSSLFPKTPVPWKIIALPSLQWHSRLARRTYKSVLTKKCEGREFEPPLEQGFEIAIRSRKGPGKGIRTLAYFRKFSVVGDFRIYARSIRPGLFVAMVPLKHPTPDEGLEPATLRLKV